MASALSKAQARAFQVIRKTAGVSVTYTRNSSSVVIDAVPGTTMMETIDDQGSMVKVKVRDYRVLSSDLVISGQAIEPERGDQISTAPTQISPTMRSAQRTDQHARPISSATSPAQRSDRLNDQINGDVNTWAITTALRWAQRPEQFNE